MKHAMSETQVKRLCKTVLHVAIESLAHTPYLPLAVEVEQSQGRLVLQIFVEKQGVRITLDECAEASLVLEAPLADLAELQAHSYVLEVSSPGLFRHLKTFRELEFYRGKTVTLKPLDVPESKATAHLFPPKQLGQVQVQNADILVCLKSETGTEERFLLSSLPQGQGLCLAPPIQWPNDEEDDLPLDAE